MPSAAEQATRVPRPPALDGDQETLRKFSALREGPSKRLSFDHQHYSRPCGIPQVASLASYVRKDCRFARDAAEIFGVEYLQVKHHVRSNLRD